MAENSTVTARHAALSGSSNSIGVEITGDSQSSQETVALALTSGNSNGESMSDLMEVESDQKAKDEVAAAQQQESEKTPADTASTPVDDEDEVSDDGSAA